MDQKEKILDSALKHFAAHGFHRTTLRDVARELGLGETALYYYFKNKEQLFRESIERGGEAVLVRLSVAIKGKTDPREKLRVFCVTRLRAIADAIDALKMTDTVHKEIFDMIEKTQVSYFKKEAVILRRIFEEGIAGGCFKKTDVGSLVGFFQHAFLWLDSPWTYFSGRKEIERKVNFALDLLLHGLEMRT
jgi:AcrR family transcriptional regulator